MIDVMQQRPYHPAVLQTQQRGKKWEMQRDFAPLLLAVLESPGEVVKHSHITSVTRHRIGDRLFYVKTQQHGRRWWWPPKYFLKSPRSRLEWRLAHQLAEGGTPVVPHLAYGERWSRVGLQETTLITEGLAGYEPLPRLGDVSVPEFQEALGQLVQQLHQVGILHEDLNRGNLLYCASTGALRLVDLDKIRLQPSLNLVQRLDNLALVGARFPLTAEFWKGYGTNFQQYAQEVDREAQAKRQVLMSRRSRHWRTHSNEIGVRRVGQLQWWVRRAYDGNTLAMILEAPDRVGERGEDGLVVQRFGFGRSGARRCFREAYRLELLNIAAPRPVAVGEKRLLGICQRSYYVART